MAYVLAGVKLQAEHMSWLDEYRAIPYGGLAMSIMGMFILGLELLCFLWFPIWTAIILTIGLIALLRSLDFSTGLFSDIKKYWEKNIRGYYACFYKQKGNIIITTAARSSLRFDFVKKECNVTVGILIPLGGWLNRAYVKYRDEIIYVRAKSENDQLNILAGDCHGRKIWLDVSLAFQIFESKVELSGNISCCWGGQLRHLLESRSLITRGREDLWNRYCGALSLIKETIRQIDGTKRFIKSKQAREIREWLLNEVMSTLPKDHPEFYTMFEPLRHKEPVAGVKK